MTNSLPRMMPLLARAHCAALFEIDTHNRQVAEARDIILHHLGDRLLVRPPKPTSPPALSSDLNQTSTTSSAQRFVFSHNSLRWRLVMMSSCPPILFISSRTICFILFWTRSRAANRHRRPPFLCGYSPARIRSCAFLETSSLGASLASLSEKAVIASWRHCRASRPSAQCRGRRRGAW
jgi:hypothetical protein